MVAGLLLAAGAGRRYGMPKALVPGWLARAVDALTGGGCAPVVVVLGAAAGEARPLVPAGAAAVVAEDWAEGMGASLRAGLAALEPTDATAALVHLVDLPDVGPEVVRRLVARPDPLARALYGGRPGHPVRIGREHWTEVQDTATGDRGARDWLAGRGDLVGVECGDLAGGRDRDRP